MTWAIHGMMVIPSDPQLQIIPLTKEGANGCFFNFRATTQGKKNGDGVAEYQYWDCSLYAPTPSQVEQWKRDIQPGSIFYVEGGIAESIPILEGKYHKTKIRLDLYKTKRLITPLWVEQKG